MGHDLIDYLSISVLLAGSTTSPTGDSLFEFWVFTGVGGNSFNRGASIGRRLDGGFARRD